MSILTKLTESSSLMSYLNMVFQLIFLIIIFLVILYLAYYSTRIIAGSKIKNMRKNNIKIIETISIGFNHIHIVEVNKQYFLISSSKEGIRMLSEIDGEGLIIKDEKLESFQFENYFKNYLDNLKAKDKKGGKYEK